MPSVRVQVALPDVPLPVSDSPAQVEIWFPLSEKVTVPSGLVPAPALTTPEVRATVAVTVSEASAPSEIGFTEVAVGVTVTVVGSAEVV